MKIPAIKLPLRHTAKMVICLICLSFIAFSCSAQLLFCQNDNVVEYDVRDTTIVLPCCVSNVEATNINEMYVKWKFKGRDILTFDGAVEKFTRDSAFKTAKIVPQKLLCGNASLTLHQSNAVPGKYTCEVTELSREGETCITLKFRNGSSDKKIPNPYICPCEKNPKGECERCSNCDCPTYSCNNCYSNSGNK